MSSENDFDLDDLALETSVLATPAPTPPQRKGTGWIFEPKQGQRFLRGPIPWAWLLQAGCGTGKALHVALAVWHQAGLKRSAVLSFNQSRLADMGVSRDSARRGLRELERLQLVSVVRHDGRKPIVTILLGASTEGAPTDAQRSLHGIGNESGVKGGGA
jgi:hypothetical protein